MSETKRLGRYGRMGKQAENDAVMLVRSRSRAHPSIRRSEGRARCGSRRVVRRYTKRLNDRILKGTGDVSQRTSCSTTDRRGSGSHAVAIHDHKLRSQITTSSCPSHGGRRYLPHTLTEHGALMAASIFDTPRAMDVSLYVIMAFVRLREMLSTHKTSPGNWPSWSGRSVPMT